MARDSHRAWWEPAARWSRVAVGAALAAGTALIAVIRTAPKEFAEGSARIVTTTVRDATEGTRAAFESAVVGRTYAETSRSSLMPSAADLLIPIGEDVAQ